MSKTTVAKEIAVWSSCSHADSPSLKYQPRAWPSLYAPATRKALSHFHACKRSEFIHMAHVLGVTAMSYGGLVVWAIAQRLVAAKRNGRGRPCMHCQSGTGQDYSYGRSAADNL